MKLSGIIPPLLTPFKENGDVDLDRIPLLVNFMKPHVKGFFVCGTYGSGVLMDVEERKKVFESVAECVDGSYQLIAHVGAASQRDALQLVEHAARHHALAVTAVPPFYFHYDDETLFQYFRELINASSVPVYLYDNPGASGNPVSAELINRLAEIGLRGVKDSTFDINKTYIVMRKVQKKDFDVVIGSESLLLPSFTMGVRACISGLANVLPELMNKLYEAAIGGDPVLAKDLQTKVLQMWDILHYGPSTPTAYAMLQARGVEAGFPRRPMLPLGKEIVTKVRKAMNETQSIWKL
jgi:N-acetylneuraminate lyase/4-hydroxy-tetrahydrodipicolinate synthase